MNVKYLNKWIENDKVWNALILMAAIAVLFFTVSMEIIAFVVLCRGSIINAFIVLWFGIAVLLIALYYLKKTEHKK